MKVHDLVGTLMRTTSVTDARSAFDLTLIQTGETILHWAVRNDHAVLSELLIAGAPVDIPNKVRAMFLFCQLDELTTMTEPNRNMQDGKTLLHCAVENGQALIAELLIKAGAPQGAQDKVCNRFKRIVSLNRRALLSLNSIVGWRH